MKKLTFITILVLCFAVQGWGQSLVNESRMLINPVNLYEYKESAESNSSSLTKSLEKSAKFTIVGEEDDSYKIYFWNWNKDTTKYKNLNYDKENNRQRYFLVKKNEINIQSVKIYDKWSASMGTLVFPFKYWPNDGSFEPTFSLNLTGGTTWNPFYTNRHTFSLLAGVGPSSAKVNKSNISSDVDVEGDIFLTAVTFSLNLIYQYEFVQFGISAGTDNLFDNKKYDWDNQGKTWLSVGIGVNLFKSDKTATPTKN